MQYGDIITDVVGIIAIIATTIIANKSIRKTAKESRITGVHTEMLS